MDPYSGTAKLVVLALLALAVLGAFARWRYVEGALDDARADNAALTQTIQAQAKNAELASAIAGRWRDNAQKRNVSVGNAAKRVYDAKKPIPPECLPVLDPVRRALDGVRDLRRERDGAAPARPDVLPGPDTASRG